MPRRVSDEEIIKCFQESRIPLECWFLCDGLVYIWDTVNLGFSCHLFEDNALYSACQDFLRRRGAVFPSLDAVMKHAKERGWPNHHLMGKIQDDYDP